MRPTREEYYMGIARIVAERSTCTRAKVGAVLIDPKTNRIVATGYNGSSKGAKHCLDEGCLVHEGHCIRTIHAETNAILHLEHNYEKLHLYCTHQPCWQCYKILLASNVVQVTFEKRYPDPLREALIKDRKMCQQNIVFIQF